jgi:lipid-binding SYLF domain-containing protein
MTIRTIGVLISLLLAASVTLTGGCQSTTPAEQQAASVAEANTLESNARTALEQLYETTPSAKMLGDKAKGVLVFPRIVKAGWMAGGQYGRGVLFKQGRVAGYYNTVAASFGLQAGAQSFSYVMLLMNDNALTYLDRSGGWEVGVGPSVVVVDAGVARSLTTTTAREDVYAFIFGQQGLMAGVGLQGSKITKITL